MVIAPESVDASSASTVGSLPKDGKKKETPTSSSLQSSFLFYMGVGGGILLGIIKDVFFLLLYFI